MAAILNVLAVVLIHQAFLVCGESSVILLDWTNNPQHVITFKHGQTDTQIIKAANSSGKYKFSLQLEKFKQSTCLNSRDHPAVAFNQPRSGWMSFCLNVDDKKNNFAYTPFSFSYNWDAQVDAEGVWAHGDEAVFVATIYQEVNQCSDCPSDSFCCDGGETCDGSLVNSADAAVLARANLTRANQIKILPRCIPMSLKCNRHPNCGLACNADEKKDDCGTYAGAMAVHVGIMSLLMAFGAVSLLNL